jgi:hypothetical protein
VHADELLGEVELDHCRVTVRARNSRSWLTTDDCRRGALDEPLELVEPGDVEVVVGSSSSRTS